MCIPLEVFSLHKGRIQGEGLGIFTNKDQQSIFGSFEFRKSVFFWVLLTTAVFFGGC